MNAGRAIRLGVLLGSLCGLLAPGVASAETSGTGQVIVRYAPGTSAAERRDARADARVDAAETLLLPRTQLVEPDPGLSPAEAIAALESEPGVLYAEPDRLMTLDAVPNDPLLPNQWGHLNAGQLVQGIPGTPGADLDAKAGWDIGRTSAGTVTAVIDSGITTDHPDLINQIWTNPGETAGNGIDDDGNGFVDDVHGWDFNDGDNDPIDGSRHGTHVAGIVGATGNNGFAITGVSWDANLMPLRVCGSVGGCPVSATVDAIVYASRMGAKVANLSLGSSFFSQAQRDAIANANNTLFAISAGNEGNDGPGLGDNEVIPKYPCMADQAPGNPPLGNVICVASTDQDDARSDFSNWGATSVDLAAPGSNIISTVPAFTNPFVDSFGGSGVPWDYSKIDLGQPATAAGWERNTGLGQGGGSDFGVTDSYAAAYAPNSNAAMSMTGSGVSLAGREACAVIFFVSLDTERPNPNNFTGADVLFVEASGDAAGPWTVLDRFAGNTSGYKSSATLDSDTALDAFGGDPTVYLRFRLQADGDVNVGSGAFVDDVVVRCALSTPGAGNFNYLQGTSMSSPQVAGIASIVRELNPGLFPAEAKAKILGGVDVLPAFSGASATPLVTGGRANLDKTLRSLDLTPPPVPVLTGPSGAIGELRPRFAWTTDEPGAAYELLIDDVPVAAGPGLAEYVPSADLSTGLHSWQVRASDHPGNVSVSESRSFQFAAAGQVKVLSIKPYRRGKGGATVRVRVSAPGRVTALARKSGRPGRPVGKASKRSRRAGVLKFRVTPNRVGRTALKRRRALKARFEVTFRPTSGGATAKAKRRGKLAAPAPKRRR